MTQPTATCELCGDTGLYSPSAVPCPKGCSAEDIVERLKNVGSLSLDQTAARTSYDAADLITNLRAYISDLEQREKDARAKALEDAAQVAESWKAMPCNPQRHFGHRDAACAISAAIRALQEGR